MCDNSYDISLDYAYSQGPHLLGIQGLHTLKLVTININQQRKINTIIINKINHKYAKNYNSMNK